MRPRRWLSTAVGLIIAAGGVVAAPSAVQAAPTSGTPWIQSFTMAHTVPAGTATTISVYLAAPLDGTPYFLRIIDQTNGLYHNCVTGSVCSWTAGFSSGVHTFVAHLDSGKGGAAPYPIKDYTWPNFITWSSAGYQLNLTGYVDNYLATANRDITTTPYYIQYYNAETGVRYASCGTGSSCATVINNVDGLVVAAIGTNSTVFPPATIVATSDTLSTNNYGISAHKAGIAFTGRTDR